jgi:hypothetical protein
MANKGEGERRWTGKRLLAWYFLGVGPTVVPSVGPRTQAEKQNST